MQKLTTAQIINLVLILLVIIFIGQNLDTIGVKFLFFQFNLPLIVIILLCLLIGYLSAIFLRKNNKSSDGNAE